MRVEIRLLHNRIGSTTVHVTHDQQEALAMADVIAVMREGRLEQVGPPLDLYNQPASAFVAGFIGDPPMSLIRAALASADGQQALRVGDVVLPLPPELGAQAAVAPAREVLVGVRPRSITLCEPDAGAISADIYAHEMVGREQQMMLAVGPDLIRWRSPQPRVMPLGAKVGFKLSLEHALLFDRASGRSLAPQRGRGF
jgi:multiple sugar transport system ATP-binding protein